jgi:hypothetical protein
LSNVLPQIWDIIQVFCQLRWDFKITGLEARGKRLIKP